MATCPCCNDGTKRPAWFAQDDETGDLKCARCGLAFPLSGLPKKAEG